MTDIKFDPGTNLCGEIINMDRQELCRLVSRLCDKIKSQCGLRSYRGGIYPENISLGADGELSLGLARSEGWDGQELEFLAPELYWNGKKSQASDVYSLGMLLYYAVNGGKLPYEGSSDNPQLQRMNGEAFPIPKAAGRRLGEIIRKATAFRPEERYKNVEELRIMLDSCCENLYLDGADGAKALFNKESSELSEMEKLMVGIIENGGDDVIPEEEPAAEAEEELPAEPESAEEPEAGEPEEPAEEPREEAAEEPAAEPEPIGEKPLEEKSAEEKSDEKAEPEEPENIKVYEPPKKPQPGKAKREPVPILTEDKNPELEPVILRNQNVQPAVQYGRSAQREKNIAEQIKKRRSRRFVSLLVICAVIVVTAIIVNALLRDMSWDRDNADDGPEIDENLPLLDGEDSNGIGIMVLPDHTPVIETPPPAPPEEAPRTSRYEVFMEDISWTEARDKCIEMGGYLVVINDQDELYEIISLANSVGLERVWIGCHRINGTLVWENGESVDFFPPPWGVPGGEPSYEDTDGTAEDYLMLWNNNGWAYNDIRNNPAADYPQYYSGTIGYICEFND